MSNTCVTTLNMPKMVPYEDKMTEDNQDALTQTPRSQLNSDGTTLGDQSPNSSSPPGSRTDSKFEDDFMDNDQRSLSDDDGQEEENAYHEDEYYAFLREMAGSFEPASEDDESEVGSDSEGSSDEDEEGQVIGRKRSCALDEFPDNGLPASRSFVGHGQAQRAGSPEECLKAKASLMAGGNSAQPSQGGYPVWLQPRVDTTGGRRQMPAASPLVAASQGTEEANECRKRPIATAVSSDNRIDNRPPVVDDYDVVKATVEFAEQRSSLSRFERQREDLEGAIRLRTDQATRLQATARKQHVDPELRSHYARVRAELLTEARTLEEQLQTLIEAANQQPLEAASCSQAEAAQVGHQERPVGVVVQ